MEFREEGNLFPLLATPYSLLAPYSLTPLFHSHPFFLNRQYRNAQMSAIATKTAG